MESFYPGIIEFITECGYREFENYWYPPHLFQINANEDYSDAYGNFYHKGGTDYRFKLTIGGGSRFTLGNYNQIDESVYIGLNCGSVLKIGNNNTFENDCRIHCFNETFLKIGDNCRFHGWGHIKNNVCIEDNVTIGEKSVLISDMHSKILIERDCMISYLVNMRAGNGHNLYDLETNENISICNKKDIILHEHIWIGANAFIFSGADIGSGSVVGANTFVNKRFSNNVAIAGNPARIVRNKVAWRRELKPLYDSYEDFKEFDFTE